MTRKEKNQEGVLKVYSPSFMKKLTTGVILSTIGLSPILPIAQLPAHAATTSSSPTLEYTKLTGYTAHWHDNSFNRMIPTDDGGYIAVGHSASARYFQFGNIVKFNSDGTIQWEKDLTNTSDLNSIHPTADGNYIIAGYSSNNDGMLIKVDPNGNTIWQKTFGGSMVDEFYSANPTPDGGYVAVGYTESGDRDLAGIGRAWIQMGMIVKYDKNGNVQWKHTVPNTSVLFDSGVDSKGNIYMSGGNGQIVKYDAAGNLVWQKQFGTQGSLLKALLVTPDDGVVVGGEVWKDNKDMTETTTGGWDGAVVKYDGNGNLQWKQAFGYAGSGNSQDGIFGLSLSNDGNILAGGWEDGSSLSFATEMDQSGNVQWQTNNRPSGGWGRYLNAGAIAQLKDGGVVLGGEEQVGSNNYAFVTKWQVGPNTAAIQSSLSKVAISLNQADLNSVEAQINQLPDSPQKAALLAQAKSIQAQIDVQSFDQKVSSSDLTILSTVKNLQVQEATVASEVSNDVTDSVTQSTLMTKLNTDLATLNVADAKDSVQALKDAVAQADLTSLDTIQSLQAQLQADSDLVNSNVQDATVKANLQSDLASIQETLNEAKATVLTGQAESALTDVSVQAAQTAIDQVQDATVKAGLQDRINEVKAVIKATNDKQAVDTQLTGVEIQLNQFNFKHAHKKDVQALVDSVKALEQQGQSVQNEINALKDTDHTKQALVDGITKDVKTANVLVNFLQPEHHGHHVSDAVKTLEESLHSNKHHDPIQTGSNMNSLYDAEVSTVLGTNDSIHYVSLDQKKATFDMQGDVTVNHDGEVNVLAYNENGSVVLKLHVEAPKKQDPKAPETVLGFVANLVGHLLK